MWFKILLIPFIPIVFAYLELGGNWFGLRLLQGGAGLWSVFGTIIFSVLYSIVAAFVAINLKVDIGLLMVNYGFGFSIVSIFLTLNWGKLPSFSPELIKSNPFLWAIFAVAIIGFLMSAYLVITAPTPTR
ncbi:MAG: hypothetical protein AAB373_00490 [Patescibacteria group bacterium]